MLILAKLERYACDECVLYQALAIPTKIVCCAIRRRAMQSRIAHVYCYIHVDWLKYYINDQSIDSFSSLPSFGSARCNILAHPSFWPRISSRIAHDSH